MRQTKLITMRVDIRNVARFQRLARGEKMTHRQFFDLLLATFEYARLGVSS